MAKDPAQTIVDILTDNWNSSNSDGVTPTVALIYDHKRIDARDTDWILLRSSDTQEFPGDIGTSVKDVDENVVIDVRTAQKGTADTAREHFRNVVEEIDRILEANVHNPDSDYQLVPFKKSWTDLSDRMSGLFRAVGRVKLMNKCVAAGS